MSWWEWLLVVGIAGILLVWGLAHFGCGTAPKAETQSTTKVEAGPGSPVSVENKPEASPATTQGGPVISPKVESPTAPVNMPVSAPQYGLDPERAKAERLRTKLWWGALGSGSVVLLGVIVAVVGWLLKQPKAWLAGLAIVASGLAGGLATWFFA
jgi:hypothetical protein